MHLVTRETTLIEFKSLPLGWGSRQSPERIEAFELQTAVIAKKFVQTRNLENHQGLVIAALNARTLTARAPHDTHPLINAWDLWLKPRAREEASKGILANHAKARQTIYFPANRDETSEFRDNCLRGKWRSRITVFRTWVDGRVSYANKS